MTATVARSKRCFEELGGMTDGGALRVEGLGVRIGARWIVRDVSFDARAGELVAVIGPNGAGKTTLLEALAGLRRASGSIRVHQRTLDGFGDFARTFSFLPDAGSLPPEATVRTLIEDASARAARDFPLRTLRQGLTVEPLLPKPIGVLSRGEHQRVALFCALALARPIAVLDEPFSAFDPLQLRKVVATLREVTGAATAIVASIHQVAEAESIADRILLLAEGRAIAFGNLASLRARVQSPTASLEDVFVSLLEEKSDAP
jgi:ABC-type multidrug transport system ATPase subunit